MKQFGRILKFELSGYWKNKVFVGTTVFFVAAIAVCMFIPNIAALFRAAGGASGGENRRPVMLIGAEDPALGDTVLRSFREAFPEYEVQPAAGSLQDWKESVIDGTAACAFAIHTPTAYTYYVENRSMTDVNMDKAEALLRELYAVSAMTAGGMTARQAGKILSVRIDGGAEVLGKDQVTNFLYTYVMLFSLYMVILLCGQTVVTNVATEKSSRAMELLITSAKPAAMMFGKVLASCVAGFFQLFSIFGSALLFYNLNKSAWGDNAIIRTVFDIPVTLFFFMLVFFVLGFLIYAFLYGAMGSAASKLEDANTLVMPVTFTFVIAFMVVMYSMSSGNVDSTLMKVCSYIPFTSPMAMFTRICMGSVAWYEIAASILILLGATVGIGFLAAKIYRAGVLMYGAAPKIGVILKTVWKS